MSKLEIEERIFLLENARENIAFLKERQLRILAIHTVISIYLFEKYDKYISYNLSLIVIITSSIITAIIIMDLRNRLDIERKIQTEAQLNFGKKYKRIRIKTKADESKEKWWTYKIVDKIFPWVSILYLFFLDIFSASKTELISNILKSSKE